MQPLIVTVAAVGAELSPSQQPNLPISPEEVGLDAERCAEAGAAIYHLHVRAADGTPTMDVDRFKAAKDAIEARTDLIVQFTSGGAVGDSEEERAAPLDLKPEMATLTTGSVNFGDEVFLNPAPLVERLYVRMRELGILPEFEIFEAGMIAAAEKVYTEHGDGHRRHFDLVIGVPGAIPAWPGVVEFLSSKLPSDATWSATGIGRSHVAVREETLSLGGHVRTGFEDVRFLEPGRPALSNAELVEQVTTRAREMGREIAGPGRAREVLGLSGSTG